MPITTNPKSWRRKMDDPFGPPAANPVRYLPDTWQEIRTVISDAEEAGLEVHACGSHWAFSDAAFNNDVVIETQDPEGDRTNANRARLNRVIYDVIPDALTDRAYRFFISQQVKPFDGAVYPDHNKFYIFHVQAGIKVAELYSLIDQGDGDNFRSLAARLPEYAGPWALRTMGGAGGQTIVGAFSTGTHGGDVDLQPIADAAIALHLIGANGRQFWIEKVNEPCMPLVDEVKLRKSYGDIEVIRNEDMFNAAKVACGRFGVIYSVVLKVVRQFALSEERTASDWTSVRSWVNDLTHPNFTKRFVQIVINSMGRVKNTSEHDCYITLRDMIPLNDVGVPPAGRAERTGVNTANSWPYDPVANDGGGSFINRICLSNDPIKAAIDELCEPFETALEVALITAGAATAALLLPIIPPPGQLFFESVRQKALAAAATALAVIGYLKLLKASIPDGMPLSLALAAVANKLAEDDRIEYMRFIAGKLIEGDQGPRKLKAISYAIMDIHSYLDANCIRNGDSIEIFFDATSPVLPKFIDRVFERIRELENGWLTGDQRVFPGYIALRYMKYTTALIGMQKWLTTCSIEIAGLNWIKGTQPFLAAIEKDAIEMGATLHWGQRNNMTMKMVESCYDEKPGGQLYRWRDCLSKITRNGRDAAFSNAFTRRTGLEVVQPKIAAFSASPDLACAGEMFTINWNAADNPPGTTAFLEISNKISGGNNVNTIVLPELQGQQQIPMPLGRNELKLVVSYTLNGRTLNDSKTVSCRGIQNGDTWRFQLPATCLKVDGLWRWGGNIVLTDFVSDTLEVDEISCRFAGAFDWYARRHGSEAVEFSWLQLDPWIKFNPRRKLKGDWYFYVKADGCTGPQPDFWVEFKIVCST